MLFPSSGLLEDFNLFGSPPLLRQPQGGPSIVVFGIDVGAGGEQGFGGSGVAVHYRPHQGGSSPNVFGIDVGARGQQGAQGIGVAPGCYQHQGCAAVFVFCIDVRTFSQQGSDGGNIATPCGANQVRIRVLSATQRLNQQADQTDFLYQP